MRSEQEIFDDLEALCSSQGFIHAIVHICFRDNVVGFSDELKAEDMAQLYSGSRLIRTEVTTLIGLMMRAPIDFILPTPETISGYIGHSEALLEELHQAMINAFAKVIAPENAEEPNFNPFTFGDFLREAIFYSAEIRLPFPISRLGSAQIRCRCCLAAAEQKHRLGGWPRSMPEHC